ncbi:RICIN domain-containing protein [Streptomyces sp. NPDC006368]|uniref:RICIN domain-containing protein n=1 Tax=Streptomyces sp. NPDC006368 TaxID=3156760 RepID=UPI0033BD46B0
MRNPPPPSPPPRPPYGPTSGGSDAFLVDALRADGGWRDAYPVAALMERHWQAVSDYVALFVPPGNAAAMVAAAAFGQALEKLRADGPEWGTAAVRVHCLVTARRVLRDWGDDARITALLPGIQCPEEPAENRRLIARAFRALPGPAQVLLWHREVEAEGISIPSALLAIDPRGATARLAEARELLRAGCVNAHHELAPDQECRHFGRLLDISLRRRGPLIPDIRLHLARCRHCRYAAEQLRHSDGHLALLLAEGVLGAGAARYLETRPGRARAHEQAPRRARHSRGGRRHGSAPGDGALLGGAALRNGAVAAVVAGVLVAGAVAALRGDGDDGHEAGTGRPGGAVTSAAAPPVVTPPAPTPAGHPTGPLSFRLRNTATGLCLDVRDGRAVANAELALAACDPGSVTQLWTYEQDGLLRSAADPALCANSHRPAGTPVLSGCPAAAAPDAADVRYDLTVQGVVVPRWSEQVALTPLTAEPGTSVVVRLRDGSTAQRWMADAPAGRPATPKAAPAPQPVPKRAASHELGGTRPGAGPGTASDTGPGPGSGAPPGPGPGVRPADPRHGPAAGGAPGAASLPAPPGGPGPHPRPHRASAAGDDRAGDDRAGEAPVHRRVHDGDRPAPGLINLLPGTPRWSDGPRHEGSL